MKTKSLFFILIAISWISCFPQATDKISGFSDFKLFYNLSSVSGGRLHISKETLIPFGAGLGFDFELGKSFSFDFGTIFKTSGKEIRDGQVTSSDGYSGPYHLESSFSYLDFPLHLNFKLLKTGKFNVLIFSGLREIIDIYKNKYNPNFDGTIHTDNGNIWSTVLDFGLTERVKITNKLGFFTSQYVGFYLTGLDQLSTLDLNLGFTYDFK